MAMQDTCRRLEGAFTLLAVHADHPDRVVAARRNSPLVIGLGDGENFLGSDVSGFIDYTKRAVEMGQDQIVTITADDYTIVDFHGNAAEGKPFDIEWDAAAAEKDGYPSFMEKEIHDQPAAVGDTLLGRLDENGRLTLDEIKAVAPKYNTKEGEFGAQSDINDGGHLNGEEVEIEGTIEGAFRSLIRVFGETCMQISALMGILDEQS